MLNYEIDPAVLLPYVPKGTELDFCHGKAYLSVVGFMFYDTRLKGYAIPFHRNFEEVNLRFYIKRPLEDGQERRAVAFIKEIVPRWTLAKVARLRYNENYISRPMKHHLEQTNDSISAQYDWEYAGKWHSIRIDAVGEAVLPTNDSHEQFITEHYWAYSQQRDGSTLEYRVEHPSWSVWRASQCCVDIDFNSVYGQPFASYLSDKPATAFLAEGSQVNVYEPSLFV